MNSEELKLELEKLGWKTYPLSYRDKDNLIDWYSCLYLLDVPFCNCNEKPPQLVIRPYSLKLPDGKLYESIEIDLVAEDKNSQWYSLKAYSVSFDSILEKLPSIKENLSKCWRVINENSNI